MHNPGLLILALVAYLIWRAGVSAFQSVKALMQWRRLTYGPTRWETPTIMEWCVIHGSDAGHNSPECPGRAAS